MAFALDGQSLCRWCRTLTLKALLSGFTHPLPYNDIVISGRRCPLCKLIVCSMGKLQTRYTSSAIERNYDAMIDALLQSPAVYHREFLDVGHFPVCRQFVKPHYVTWDRCNYKEEPGNFDYELRKGNFDRGETIQVTADKRSWYRAAGIVPLNQVDSMISKENFDMARGWMKTCLDDHYECSKRRPGEMAGTSHNGTPSSANLPTRVIDVAYVEGNEFQPRLVRFDGKPATYVALSHRWGNEESTLKTLSSTIQAFQKGLPMDSLPKTFHHAIEFTRQLEVRHLWIDSLCIVQDDPDDWKRESQKMGYIFESSICVIAATDSVDSQGHDHGLFRPRNDPLAVGMCIPFDKIPLDALSTRASKREGLDWKYIWPATNHLRTEQASTVESMNAAIYLRPRIESLSCRVGRTAWYNRGWVLQERLLPSRIIYFTKDKMYWSCFTTTKEEENSDPAAPHRRCVFHSEDQGMRDSHWESILSDYIRCSVTFDRDRLMAISGITRRFEQYYSVNIHAGILDDRTGLSLLWYMNGPSAQGNSGFHAPSWSWASLPGSVSFLLAQPILAGEISLIRDLRYETRNSCPMNNPEGACQGTCLSGRVSFTGPLGRLNRISMLVHDVKIKGVEGDLVNNDKVMESLLGSAIYSCSTLQSFDDEWNLIPTQQKLFIPTHTELLADDEGNILGFLIPDNRGSPPRREKVLFCAAIQLWGGNEASSHSEIDFVGLEVVKSDSEEYRRVGRGRIICNAWLSTCKERSINIV